MAMTDSNVAGDGQQKPEPHDTHAASDTDPERIAERVYRLMIDEVRLERARGASTGSRRRV